MVRFVRFDAKAWDEALAGLLKSHRVYAPVMGVKTLDYELISEDLIPEIVYNIPKPVVPLKTFLLPVKENVVLASSAQTHPTIIMGVPACDLSALDLLDKFFLDEDYPDVYYANRRRETILIGTDCHSAAEHCHCSSYGLQPFPGDHADLTFSRLNGDVWMSARSDKGDKLLQGFMEYASGESTDDIPQAIQKVRNEVRMTLDKRNKRLPNYQETTDAVIHAEASVWHSYSRQCVACGACAAACPTCTCFLLVDRPGFEKVRQMDACQYPGFERTAGGEDPLKKLEDRFRNRYMCKYLYRPEKYDAIACTGCGRCIDTCIGQINKNELLVELTK